MLYVKSSTDQDAEQLLAQSEHLEAGPILTEAGEKGFEILKSVLWSLLAQVTSLVKIPRTLNLREVLRKNSRTGSNNAEPRPTRGPFQKFSFYQILTVFCAGGQCATVQKTRKTRCQIEGRDRHAEEQQKPGPSYQELYSSSMKYPSMYRAGSLRNLHEKKMVLKWKKLEERSQKTSCNLKTPPIFSSHNMLVQY